MEDCMCQYIGATILGGIVGFLIFMTIKTYKNFKL